MRVRETQTPKLKGVPPHHLQKFKKAARVNNNMKDIVFVYADLGPRRLRQKTIPANVYKQPMQPNNRTADHADVDVENQRILASEMGNKPNSRVMHSKKAASSFE